MTPAKVEKYGRRAAWVKDWHLGSCSKPENVVFNNRWSPQKRVVAQDRFCCTFSMLTFVCWPATLDRTAYKLLYVLIDIEPVVTRQQAYNDSWGWLGDLQATPASKSSSGPQRPQWPAHHCARAHSGHPGPEDILPLGKVLPSLKCV